MRYLEVLPPPALRPFVRCLWLAEDDCGAGEAERVVPDGCVDLVVHYGHSMLRRLDGDAIEAQPGAVVAGQLRTATRLETTGAIGMVGARFHPWGAAPFLRESLNELTAQIVPLDAIWGHDGVELEERVHAAGDDATRLQLLTDALASRLLPDDEVGRSLREAVTWIDESHGAIAVSEIARRLQWSTRRLERHFLSTIGLSPKSLCRIERIQQVLRQLPAAGSTAGAAPGLRLAELALDAGYADQAHLAREFKALAGLSVTRYLAEQHALSDSFTSGETMEERFAE